MAGARLTNECHRTLCCFVAARRTGSGVCSCSSLYGALHAIDCLGLHIADVTATKCVSIDERVGGN